MHMHRQFSARLSSVLSVVLCLVVVGLALGGPAVTTVHAANTTTTAPTTASPASTTADPTTAAPTTAEPSTAAPTTAAPSTAAPTTAAPTTPVPPTPPANSTNTTDAPGTPTPISNGTSNATSANVSHTRTSSQSLPSMTREATPTISRTYTRSSSLSTNESGFLVTKSQRSQEKSETKLPPPPATPVPELNGDDLLDPYDYYVSLILDVPSFSFDPDRFEDDYLDPALVNKTLLVLAQLIDWCGVDSAAVPADWHSTFCVGVAPTELPATIVRFRFARERGTAVYRSSNIDLTNFPKLLRNSEGKEYYEIVKAPEQLRTEAPGVIHRAVGKATSPVGIVIIVVIVILLIVVIAYVVRKSCMGNPNKAQRSAAYEPPQPPAPGRATDYEMSSQPRTAINVDGASPPPSAPAGGGADEGRPSHQSREMDVAY